MNKSQPRKQPRQARSQAMVENILQAAAEVLIDKGYARTNTNLVAAAAGISVGSLYQYFPHKDALIAALHTRHVTHMHAVIGDTLQAAAARDLDLSAAVHELVQAWMRAHEIAPELHRILEAEAPFFDLAPDAPEVQQIHAAIRALLTRYRSAITPPDLELATYIVLKTIESLVHALVIAPPEGLSQAALGEGIVEAVLGYLTLARPTP
ncbi:MAG: TetR/AcrR family transcriptional regulator [Candidatus Sericytochromatia bacterium]